MKRYFFCVKYLLDGSDPQLLAGRCISVLHGYMIKHLISSIGVSFPQWSYESLGLSIAFVSDDLEHLRALRAQSYFKMMSDEGFFAITEVMQVPDNLQEVRFVRNQSIAKLFAGETRRRLARAKRRAEERGDVFEPVVSNDKREVGHFHRLKAGSKSNGEDFILHIQKENVNRPLEDEVDTEFNNYGFATNISIRGMVPELSEYITKSRI
ncbi:type I-F CRISPR-associated endoribonuclease Cas6/Csy4 [Neptunomonas qingdaonensis]|uniref:CRISPR-associated endonuclease Csy4 n=1 Tax=Neptunomonas qingdaonensis TaxID=1045558 RepID=A0A1I2TQU8_9GAMM|nr:type I-F CRISPR-associated endoribonuclease Cas6/Csy4 [Neptunomonas qingdaonensis]SFG66549.1 CRISPR-associated endonuclease Csy4 [Neptunomonas qingdaonensis]